MTDIDIIRRLGIKLMNQGLYLAVAESCTGGGLAQAITEVSGASKWFDRGFVTYTPESKAQMLDVDMDSITKFGVVSEQVALEMAKGTLLHSNANVSIAITGLAGPTTDGKNPVGTVWFALASDFSKPEVFSRQFKGVRSYIKDQAIHEVLTKVEQYVQS